MINIDLIKSTNKKYNYFPYRTTEKKKKLHQWQNIEHLGTKQNELRQTEINNLIRIK